MDKKFFLLKKKLNHKELQFEWFAVKIIFEMEKLPKIKIQFNYSC
jgi:hypothetical protein